MKNIKLILTLAAVAATMALGGCAGGPTLAMHHKFKGTSGYSSVVRALIIVATGYECRAVEPRSVCDNRDKYNQVFTEVQQYFNGPNLYVTMLIPKSINIHSHDILRFKDARVTGGALGSAGMSAQFDGIARKYNKQDKTCELDHGASDFPGVNLGVVRCNGWDGTRFYKTGNGYAN